MNLSVKVVPPSKDTPLDSGHFGGVFEFTTNAKYRDMQQRNATQRNKTTRTAKNLNHKKGHDEKGHIEKRSQKVKGGVGVGVRAGDFGASAMADMGSPGRLLAGHYSSGHPGHWESRIISL